MIELVELLSDRFTVINYDRRGRGDSGDTRPYAVKREIEDLVALRAAAAGLPIEKVAVYETPFRVDPTGHLPPPDFAQRLDQLLGRDRRSAAVTYYMTRACASRDRSSR